MGKSVHSMKWDANFFMKFQMIVHKTQNVQENSALSNILTKIALFVNQTSKLREDGHCLTVKNVTKMYAQTVQRRHTLARNILLAHHVSYKANCSIVSSPWPPDRLHQLLGTVSTQRHTYLVFCTIYCV